MKINDNIAALQTYTNLLRTGRKLESSIERLSSGYKINSVSDDAAGMAVSKKLKNQVNGMEMAGRNTKDGISLIESADSAMSTIQDMLQRVRELAVLAANETNQNEPENPEDVQKYQDEINQLLDEINDTAYKTEFNTKKMLDGGASKVEAENVGDWEYKGLKLQIGANKGMTITVNIPSISQIITDCAIAECYFTQEELQDALDKYMAMDGSIDDSDPRLQALAAYNMIDGTISTVIDSGAYSAALASGSLDWTYTELQDLLDKFVADGASVDPSDPRLDAILNNLLDGNDPPGIDLAAYSTALASGSLTWTEADLQDALNRYMTMDPRLALDDPRRALLADSSLGLMNNAEAPQIDPLLYNRFVKNSDLNVGKVRDAVTEQGLVSVLTAEEAGRTIRFCDAAISAISEVRSKLGAYANRLELTFDNLTATQTATEYALSRIVDTDMALEMTNYTTYNVINQAAIAILSQANQRPQQILQLLS